MLSKLFSASCLLPLLLASPMIPVGPYGVSLAEILIILGGLYLLLGRNGFSVPVPKFLVVYVCLYAIGWLTSLYNAANWGIPVGLERLNFLYLASVPLLAYLVGRYSSHDIGRIVTNKFAYAVLCAVAIVAAVYPLLDTETRQFMLYYFWADVDSPRFGSPRFPGMGINANLYSYTVFVFLLFAFDRYLKDKSSFAVPLFAAIVIVAASSKLIMFLSAASCGALWIAKRVAARKHPRLRPVRSPWGVSRKAFYIGMLVVGAVWLGIRYSEELSALRDTYVFLGRLEEVLDNQPGAESPLEARMFHWNSGLERVQLAPLLGIAMPPATLTADPDVLYFNSPHNEFIYYWSAYGMFGLAAHVFLVGYLLALNILRRSALPWIILYLTLICQMFFDGAFQAIRFVAMFFLIAGLNVRYLQHRKERSAQPAIPALGMKRS